MMTVPLKQRMRLLPVFIYKKKSTHKIKISKAVCFVACLFFVDLIDLRVAALL